MTFDDVMHLWEPAMSTISGIPTSTFNLKYITNHSYRKWNEELCSVVGIKKTEPLKLDLTFELRQKLKALAGPNGYTVYKAMLAQKGVTDVPTTGKRRKRSKSHERSQETPV